MNWIEYNEDLHSRSLRPDTYLCRLEYPDGRVKYTLKHFNVYGNSIKRGYFTRSELLKAFLKDADNKGNIVLIESEQKCIEDFSL